MNVVYFCKSCGFISSDDESKEKKPDRCPKCKAQLCSTGYTEEMWHALSDREKESAKKKISKAQIPAAQASTSSVSQTVKNIGKVVSAGYMIACLLAVIGDSFFAGIELAATALLVHGLFLALSEIINLLQANIKADK